LHWAANNGQVKIVKLLINAGAEVSPVSGQNPTPLDLALQANQWVIVNIFTLAGAKGGEGTSHGCNAQIFLEGLEGLTDPKGCTELIVEYGIPTLSPVENSCPPDKLSLTLDKPLGESLLFGQFIYPSKFPGKRANYHHRISHPLDSPI
jgi:ankyrin repeat protein